MPVQSDARVIKLGRSAWNEWRRFNISTPNLSRLVLCKAELDSVNFFRTRLCGADLRGAVLSGATLVDADFTRSNLSTAQLDSTIGMRVNMTESTVVETTFNRSSLSDARFTGANALRARFSGTDLTSADFSNVTATHAIFTDATLVNASFRGADLTDASLAGANLVGVDFTGAVLTRTSFAGARMARCVFCNVDLSRAKGLADVRHFGPSSIGIDTLYASRAEIPEIFMRGAGVSPVLVTYSRSLVLQAVDLHSCFLCYATNDEDFVGDLYKYLTTNGVSCWFAPEDLKIGDRLRDTIYAAIGQRDKVLLVLSRHSVRSRWVEHEVYAAIEEEARRERTSGSRVNVLLPVRLDGAIFDVHTGWAMEVRQRYIGDFTGIEDYANYQYARKRLLADLRVGSCIRIAHNLV
jgi:hypothetical protein